MGSESSLKLPLIDFNKLDLGDHQNPNEWEEVKSQVFKALKEYGCFEALFDKVPLDLRKSLFVVLKQLFDLPLQTKLRYVSERSHRGYAGQNPHTPLLEYMGIDDAVVLEKVESLEKNLWSEGNPSFSKTIQSFSEKLSELDQIVRKMILESLGIEKYLEEHINSTDYLLRVMKYEGPQTEKAVLGVPPHSDKNTMTILCHNEVEGLEFETKDGKWVTYQRSSPHSFVILIGETLFAWTNGRLHDAPYHRVMMTGNETRYSIGLFSVPKEGYLVKVPEELVDEEHPLLFKPFVQSEFMKYLNNRENQKRFALKRYCGV